MIFVSRDCDKDQCLILPRSCYCHIRKNSFAAQNHSFMNDLQTGIADLPTEEHSPQEKESFFPIGAIMFFLLLVLLCIAFWFGIYSLMIRRI